MKKNLRLLPIAFLSAVALNPVVAAGPDAAVTCSACHGANGISVSDNIPNLAGQKAGYLAKQLQNFKSGARSNPLMSAMAGQLNDEQITELAAHFSSLPVEDKTDNEDVAAALDMNHMKFPANYESEFVKYSTSNRADNKQVRYLMGNKTAIDGAKAGDVLPNGSELLMVVYKAKLDADSNPITGDDGFYVSDTLAGYGFMQKEQGWGDRVPELLRNGDWNYAFFGAEKNHKAGVNQAACLACHQPLKAGDYMFHSEELRTFARAQ